MWRSPSWRGLQWGVVSLAQLRRRGDRAARGAAAGAGGASCAGCTAACTRSAGRCSRGRGGGWRRSWPAGRARCSVTSAPRCTGTSSNTNPPRPDVTAPASRKGVPGIRLHRSHSLDAQDTTDHQGIPTTTVAPHAARHRGASPSTSERQLAWSSSRRLRQPQAERQRPSRPPATNGVVRVKAPAEPRSATRVRTTASTAISGAVATAPATAPPAPPGTPRAPTRRSSSRARAPGSGPSARRRRRPRRPRPSRPAATRSA